MKNNTRDVRQGIVSHIFCIKAKKTAKHYTFFSTYLYRVSKIESDVSVVYNGQKN